MRSCYKDKLLSKGYVVIKRFSEAKSDNNDRLIAAIINSFSSLGYAFSKNSLDMLTKLNNEELNFLYNENINTLKRAKGANVKHVVFYPEFPNMEAISDEEYYIRAILHYLTSTENSYGFMNQDKHVERVVKKLSCDKKDILNIVFEEDTTKIIVKIAKDLFESKIAIPSKDKQFLKEVIYDYSDLLEIDAFPFKENLATFISVTLKVAKLKNVNISDILTRKSLKFIKTCTDLLRVYAAISNPHNINLTEDKIHFVSLGRKERRLFLSILNSLAEDNPYITDDFARHEFYWKKAFEKLHVGEYKNKYPFIYKAAYNFRNDAYKTYYGLIETCLSEGDIESALIYLSNRPGDFARKLDRLLRNYNEEKMVLSYFKKRVHLVSTNVLLQLWEYYKNRVIKDERFFIFNNGNDMQYFYTKDNRNELSQDTISEVLTIIEEGLKKIYSTYPRIEKVYIDPTIVNYAVPTNARNGSCQNKTLTFGTRIKLDEEEGSFIRLFTHWKNSKKFGRVDIDLAIELYSEDFSMCQSVSWHDMSGGRNFNTYHSGDITSAPNGASEFIDLNYQKARKYYRYVVVTNYVYTGQDYCDIPECFSGVMLFDKKGKEGKVFDPQFVRHKFDLTQKGVNSNIAFVVDLETMEMIWMDTSIQSGMCCVSEGDKFVDAAVKKALKEHMNLYDFFMLHKGHISLVDTKEEAEFIISEDPEANIKPYDVEIISSQWF